MKHVVFSFLAFMAGFSDDQEQSLLSVPQLHQPCDNTPTSRHCWGPYDIDTNYYTTIPDTGDTVEVWLSVQEGVCNQDGFRRSCMTVNGTIPGPAIIANWGDELVVHVTNTMQLNGTAIHWHGVRQFHSVEYDGVPGVTQCPIRPGETLTYKFRVTQYGTGWYHSHFSLQYSEGLFGPLIFNGPATSNYDEDLGALFLQDWSHSPVFTAWSAKEKYGITHSLSNLLINGTNTFDCSAISDPDCIGDGKKFQTVFQLGKRYRIRLINVGVDSQFHFSIDGHRLRVIANDFVPIEPYDTDSVVVSAGQRYDVVVEANASPGDYWLRGGWVTSCAGVANDHPDAMTGIVRYDHASIRNPTSTSMVKSPKDCLDEPQASLVPHLKYNVTNVAGTTIEELNMRLSHKAAFLWTINSTSFESDWSNPTLKQVFNNVSNFPIANNIVAVDKKTIANDEWTILVIENKAAGLLGNIAHPLHLHGHDFWILAQEQDAIWDGTDRSFQMNNPPRRDGAVLPARGYLAIAIRLDNPGVWLIHCHIAWHLSQGLSLALLESESSIDVGGADREAFGRTCAAWNDWKPGAPWPEGDAGI